MIFKACHRSCWRFLFILINKIKFLLSKSYYITQKWTAGFSSSVVGTLRMVWFTCRVMWTAQNPPGGTWEGSSTGQVVNLQSSRTCHWSQPAWFLLGRGKANKISHGQKTKKPHNKQWFLIWAQIEYLRAGSQNFRCWLVIGIDFPWSCLFHGQFDGVFSGVTYTMLVNDCLEQYHRDQPGQKKLPTAWIDIHSPLRWPLSLYWHHLLCVHCADHLMALTWVYILLLPGRI